MDEFLNRERLNVNLEDQKKLFNLLKEEILDLDIKNYKAEITDEKISELAKRLVADGVTVEEIIPQF